MSAEMPSLYKKRKRNVLNIKEKCDIITKLKQGQSVVSISTEYNVCRSTIWSIKQSESRILSFSAQIGTASNSRKTMKKAEDYNLDACVYKWFLEQTGKDIVLSNQMICDEAFRLYKESKGESLQFKATRGWLRRFKARYGITNYYTKNCQKDDTPTNVESENNNLNVTAGTPVSEKSEESEYRCKTEETTKTDKEINKSSIDNVIPKVDIKEEEPLEIMDEEEMSDESMQRKPTDEEAFNAIDTVIQWAEMQREVSMDQLMFLRTLQSTAAKRALASISRQT